MNSIYLIKSFNLIGLLLIPLNYIFGAFGYQNKNGLIYFWLCIIGFILNYFYRRKSKILFLVIGILFMPLLTAQSIDQLIYLAIYCITAILVIIKGMSVVRYDIESEIFRRGLYLCLGTFIFSLILGSNNIFISLSSYYVVIYLVSSVILLRNLRFLEYNRDSMEGRRINNRNSIIIVLFSGVLSISNVTVILIGIIKSAYLYIADLFMHMFAWIFIGIGYLISAAIDVLTALIKKLGSNTQELEPVLQDSNINLPQVKKGEVLIDKLLNNAVFQVTVRVFVILLTVYITLRLFSGLMNRESENEEYSEEKEFIINTKSGDNSLKSRFFDFMKPRSNEEKVRQYYRKYIKRCLDKDIEINEMDTTEEIRNKSQKKFEKTIINNIRNVYIKIRYGEKGASKETVKEMGEYYNAIRKQ